MKTKQETITIETAIDEIMQAAKDQLQTLAGSGKQIILGLKSGPLASKIESINANFEEANKLLALYTSFFKGKPKSFQLFTNELLPFVSMTDEQTDKKIRLMFIEFSNIEIPNFPRQKKSTMVYSINYEVHEENFFLTFRKLLVEFRKTNIERYTEDLFDSKILEFKITQQLEDKLTESHTKKATIEQVSEFIGLAFIVQGLNALSEIKDGHLFDSATQSQEINQLLLSIRHNLKLTADGISIDTLALKQRFGFNETIARMRIHVKRKETIENYSTDTETDMPDEVNTPSEVSEAV